MLKSNKNLIDNSTYLKLEPEQIEDIRKQELECQMALLKIIKIISAYKILRKKESIYKIKLKNLAKNIKKNIKEFKKTMPHPKEDDLDFVEERKTEVRLKEYGDIDEQLNAIKEKLKSIG